MNRLPNRFYEFASFRIDVAERCLWRNGQNVPLTPKVFDILLALVENSGHTLKKEELMQRVWADTFVEEGNLNRNVSTLRKILGDDSHQQRFIKTIPKQGYRFTSEVQEIFENTEEFLIEDKTSYQLKVWEEFRPTEKEPKNERGRFRNASKSSGFRYALAFFILLVIGIAAAWVWNQPNKNEASGKKPENAKPLELYQKGRALWQTRNGQNLHEATLLLEQAIGHDPNFALAHAALADAYAFDFRYWEKAKTQARKAIRLDPNLGEPYAAIGFVKMFWEWKFEEAEREFKEAIRLSPNYATAHQWYAINLLATGTAGNAAYVEMSRALELESDSVSINADMCQTLYFLRRYDEALVQCQKTLTIDDKFQNTYHYLYEIYNAQGMYQEAVQTYFKIEELALKPSAPDEQKKLREAYRTGGISAFWRAKIALLSGKSPLHYRIAQYYARLGESDKAFIHLRQAFETHDFEFYLVLADPVFDNLPRRELTELKNLIY